MGDKVILTVEERTVLGKKVKQLRKAGLCLLLYMAPMLWHNRLWRPHPRPLRPGGALASTTQ
jgi:hypothetical protein